MDYDKIFNEDINKEFFYTNYPGRKLMLGKISLENAKNRLSKNEYYAFVTYNEGEILPQEYVAINGLPSDDGMLFATVNPDINRISYICDNGKIQMISRLPDNEPGNPKYLLGSGPDEISQRDIVLKEYQTYRNTKENSVYKTK